MSRIIKTIAQSDLSEEFVNKLRCERTAALICRLCATLRKTDCFVSIRDPNLNLCVKLARCCQFRFPENDRLPENVCVDCVHVLNECWTFAEKVRVAQESLNALYAVNEESEEEQEAEQTNKEIANTSSANPITNRSVECFENPSKIKQEIFAQIPIEELDTNFEIDENELDAEDDEDSADEEDSSPEIDPNYLPTEETDMLESLDDDMTELMDGVPDSKIEIIDTWKEYPWTCTICTGVFTSVIELRNHVTLNHNKTDAGYVCADCSKVYTKYYLFLNHVRTHRSQLKMYCDICSEFLDVPKAVSSHRDKHQCGDLVSLCTSCCKAFKNSSAMLTHLRSHSVQKKFQCELCDKSFGSKPNLRAHQKIHMGLKEFVCDQCGKGFVQKANLDEHLITHVDATPYECNECGRINPEKATGDKTLFKIWNCSRTIKKMVLTHATINCLLKQAWRKQLNGREICLEADGTLVDEDAILKMCAEQPLMILAKNEKWTRFSPQNLAKKDDRAECSLPYLNLDTQTSFQQEDSGSRVKDRFANFQEKSPISFLQPTTLISPSSCTLFADKDIENSYISKTIGNKFENFTFPWNKFPNHVLELCHKNMKLGSHLKSVVHVLVDELRAISCHIPIPVFRSVTATLIAKFPKSFSYTDADGNPLPVTNSPLITSMIHRNNYLNRPTTSKSKGHSPVRQRKRQKTTKSLQDSIMNWEVSSDIKVDDEDHLIRSKEKLIALSSNITNTKEQNEIIKELMQQLYESQRNFLNSFKECPSIKDVRNEWPFLLQKIFIREHFLNLAQIDTNEILMKFEENINKILKYATEKKDKLLLEARENQSNDDIVAFNFICKYFGEDIENIFQTFPIGITQEEIRPKGNFPWIALIETESDKMFYIFVDSEIANCQCRSFPEAFVVTFCLFFNFNRDYPAEISLSYEFLQRYFFGINLEKPRGHKRNLSSIAKVIRLINSIRE